MACQCSDFRGRRLDTRTQHQVLAMEKLLGVKTVIVQGCCNKGGVTASAGTHDCEGVLDFSVRGLSNQAINKQVRAGRRVGLWGWLRTSDEGPWAPHHHAVSVGCTDLAPAAARQVQAARNGRNGLRSNALDRHRGMGLPVVSWEQFISTSGRPTLHQGDRGPAVAYLQAALGVVADGRFGPKTAAALNAFKRRHGLQPDAIAGHAVWLLIDSK